MHRMANSFNQPRNNMMARRRATLFLLIAHKACIFDRQVFWRNRPIAAFVYYSRLKSALCLLLCFDCAYAVGFSDKGSRLRCERRLVKKTIEVIKRGFYPQTSFLVKTPANAEELEKLAPFTKNYMLQQEKTSAFYICENKSCSAPVNSLEEMLSSLK